MDNSISRVKLLGSVDYANPTWDGDGLKTLRFQLLLWGFALALMPAFLFVAWVTLNESSGSESFFLQQGLAALAFAATFALLAIALFFWTSRNIIAPLQEITAAVKAIREGEYDVRLEERLLFRGPLEIRALCYTVSRMTEKIDTHFRAMEKTNLTLLEKEERWKLVLKGNKDGVWDWNLQTDKIVQSKRCLEMLGFEGVEGPVTHEEWVSTVHPEDLADYRQKLTEHLDGLSSNFETEYRRLCKDGSYKWVLDRGQAQWDRDEKPIRMAGSLTDIDKRKKQEEKLVYFGMKDSLTGLYNRSYFQEEMRRLNDGRYSPIAIIVCDLDGLKLYNDSFGHHIGDRLIQSAADIMVKTFRAGDVVSRIGGDEFAILLPRVTRETVDAILKRFHSLIDEFNSTSADFLLSISSGMAISHSKNVNLPQLFREADNNMYREKNRNSQKVRAAITRSVVRLLERRDYVVEGHTKRVGKLCERLGQEMGLSVEKIKELYLLAEYHDLGKVGISDKILFKQGALSEAEIMEMQRHSEIGYRIALSVAEIRPVADYILKHQEWWNGKGYPLGLVGEQIPLECRILAIADAYDTMTSERPYRPALGHEEAMRELKQGAGTQFEPFLVELFSRIDPRQCLQKVG